MKKKDIAKKMQGEIVSKHKFSATESQKDMGGNTGSTKTFKRDYSLGKDGDRDCNMCSKTTKHTHYK